MKKVNKKRRLAGLGILIIRALMGIGIGGALGPVFSTQKERSNDNGVRIELVETKEEDSDSTQLKDVKS